MKSFSSLFGMNRQLFFAIALLPFTFAISGCRNKEPIAENKPEEVAEAKPPEPMLFEATAAQLLTARLPAEQAQAGWIRLFDGHTMFGWHFAGHVDWKIAEGAVQATTGDIALMCTTTKWKDYELELEFNADADTNSGVFLRTDLLDTDPTKNCYEFNIAPPDNPFPTGSIVGRQKVEPDVLGELKPGEWHRLKLRIEGSRITAAINDKEILDWTDPATPLETNFIGLQHNTGRIAFRDVRLKPLGLAPLLDKELAKWKRYPEFGGKFEMTEAGELHVTGGNGQLESLDSFGDFVLHANVRTNAPDLNGGLFFRCIPGEKLNGYECQIQNGIKNKNPLLPVDCGTGGIFRRVDARLVAGEDQTWTSIVVHARGPNFATWVNGLQVVDWDDTREPDPNPRKGRRLEPGTIAIQAHDETTDLSYKTIDIVPL